jgi:ATP-dependent helicase/nuclease subunit B
MMLPPFLESVAEGSFVMLPTVAAARGLRRTFDDAQRARGCAAWQPVNILSWQQFLDHLWSQAIISGVETRLLLNAAQEHALWLEAIAAKPGGASLASPDALADLAAQAWSMAGAYNCVARLAATANTVDTRAFAAWAEAFNHMCEREGCLTAAGLEAALAQHIAGRALAAPTSITLVSFPAFTPAQQRLMDTLHDAGVRITEHDLAVEAPRRQKFAATSAAEELRAIAQYIRARLEADPKQRIAVVVPDAAELPQVEIVFREILAPELCSITADVSSAPWELPNVGPLAAQAVVSTAVDLLQLCQSPQDHATITGLLLSPYLGSAADRETAPRFDAEHVRTRKTLRPELDLGGLYRVAQSSAKTPAWIRSLHAFIATANLTAPRTHADWAAFLRALLRSASWPGPRSLTSLEFQATEAFNALLDTLSTLDFRGRRVSFADFLHALTRQTANTVFTRASTNAPIQVLSLAAALSQSFDLLVIARAVETNYPPREQRHALLSFALQGSLDMPGANAESSTARARADLAQLLSSAPEVLLTYTPATAEGTQRFAPLLESLTLLENIRLEIPTPPARIVATTYVDDAALPPLPSAEVSGGARVLKLQAACGFLAFSELRLLSTQPQSPNAGFDAMESGNILHRTLDHFWQHVKTQETLRSYSRETRREVLTQSIALAIPSSFNPQTDWEKAYLALQKERLLKVLDGWMDKELERAPFTVIASEKKEIITVGALTLNVRMDRIDQVENGHVFVDYKTGSSANPKHWEGERPEDPQLPLYALFSQPGELKGLAFARVRPGKENQWSGYQADDGILPVRGTRDIEADIAQWRGTLAALADSFAAGVADVNPKSFAVNCKRCMQRLLCRVHPESFLAEDEPDSEEIALGDSAE